MIRMIDFKGYRFEKDIILLCVRWYLAYPPSYRNLEEVIAMPVRCSAWYRKTYPTFSDALALVRRQRWAAALFSMSRSDTPVQKIPSLLLQRLTKLLCFAA